MQYKLDKVRLNVGVDVSCEKATNPAFLIGRTRDQGTRSINGDHQGGTVILMTALRKPRSTTAKDDDFSIRKRISEGESAAIKGFWVNWNILRTLRLPPHLPIAAAVRSSSGLSGDAVILRIAAPPASPASA